MIASLNNKRRIINQDVFNGLLAYYRFSNNLNDEANSNNASGTDITYVTNSYNNSVASFNGTSSLFNIPHQDYWSFTDGNNDTPFTLGMSLRKINQASVIIINKVLSTFSSGFGNEFVFNIDSLERPTFRLYDGINGGTSRIGIRANNSIIGIDTDHVIYFTYDGSEANTGLKMYLDGVEITNLTYELNNYNGIVNGGEDIIAGTTTSGSANLQGYIGELNLWNRELTAQEIVDNTNKIQNNISLI